MNVQYDIQTLKDLSALGAHYLRCRADKSPIDRWTNPCALDKVLAHANKGGLIGIIPASVGGCVVDLDEGERKPLDELFRDYGYEAVQTRKGWHYWTLYDGEPLANAKWAYQGASGDLRHGRGYVVLWDAKAVLWLFDNDYPAEPVPKAVISKLLPAKQVDMWAQGNRNNTLNAEVFKAVKSGKPLQPIIDKAREVGLDDKAIQATVASASKAGTKRLDTNELPPPGFDSLQQALDKLGIGYRYEVRSMKRQLFYMGDWTDLDDMLAANVRRVLERKFVFMVGKRTKPWRISKVDFDDCLNALLHLRRVDGFKAWLEDLAPWDGTDRLDFLLYQLFNAEPAPVVEWAARYPIIGAIQRAYEPGGRLDEVPVLIGPQNLGKSMYLECLLPQRRGWFGVMQRFDLKPQARAEAMQGKVLVEVPELKLNNRTLDTVKAFLTTRDDTGVRLAYRRDPQAMPRRCIFVATTNNREVLSDDPSGNRRFKPVDLIRSDGAVEALLTSDYVDQLWAEGLKRYKSGTRANWPRSLQLDLSSYTQTDELVERILASIDGSQWQSMQAIAQQLDLPTPLDRRTQLRLGKALRNAGWIDKRMAKDGKQMRLWAQRMASS